MPAQVANVIGFNEEPRRQLPLHSEAVIHRIRNAQVGVDRVYGAKRSECRGCTARRIGKIPVLKLRTVEERRNIHLRKDQVAFNFVVKHAEATADRCLIIIEWRISKAETRSRAIGGIIKAARRSYWNGQDIGAVSVTH